MLLYRAVALAAVNPPSAARLGEHTAIGEGFAENENEAGCDGKPSLSLQRSGDTCALPMGYFSQPLGADSGCQEPTGALRPHREPLS